MAKNKRPTLRVVLNNDEGVAVFLSNMEATAEGLVPTESWEDLEQQVPAILDHCVRAIQAELAAGVDLWDVLEVVRQMTAPGDLGEFKESLNTSLPVVVEIVALIGTSIDFQRIETVQGEGRTGPSIENVIAAAEQIAKLAQVVAFASSSNEHLGKAAQLTGLLRTFEVSVRGRNYLSVSRDVAQQIFAPKPIHDLVQTNVGFTPDDVAQVWAAFQTQRSESLASKFERFEELRAITISGQALSEKQITEGRQLAAGIFIEPGNGLSFTVSDLVEQPGLPEATVKAVLSAFCFESTGVTAFEACEKFVNGENLLSGKGLLHRNDRYFAFGDPLPHDYVRPILESRLKAHQKPWMRYQRHRDSWTEEKAGRLLAQLLGVDKPTYSSLEYRAPKPEALTWDLSKGSHDPLEGTLETEADALFIIDDVAICVEVKAGSITDKARAGNVQRVETDLRKTIGEASSQAARLESLIAEQKGLWTPKGRWIDLPSVQEVHTVVVCLDDWGPLAIATDELVKAEVLTGPSVPWLISLHDLMVIAAIMQSPSDFLAFLRRRTDPSTSRLLRASDELDLVMWFMDGGLYFEPDPFPLYEKYPTSTRPRQAERDIFKDSNVLTQVLTHTDPLDAWMYFEEGQTAIAAPQPIRKHETTVASVIGYLEESKSHGWLRTGADFAGVSNESAEVFSEYLNRVVRRTTVDRRFHKSIMTFVTPWGYLGIFVGSGPVDGGMADYAEKLQKYAQLKKYQLRLDRSFALLVDTSGRIIWSEYNNLPNSFDAQLEQQLAISGLMTNAQMREGTYTPPETRRGKKPKKTKNRRR
ncbi:hypothetical protein GCM10007173_25930 [Glutamicibacter ardleyensis]|uniref:Preprotein translocase subunit SecA n=2 Tax=Glutamicibacter ardleyensis TaxID=225894 RepID=A0ABQ2DPD6_9MICC|nr:hypothetical protein GCM10007173_25930 [Glutamicibacter ardleyensis]